MMIRGNPPASRPFGTTAVLFAVVWVAVSLMLLTALALRFLLTPRIPNPQKWSPP
jgi:hypothetical protein